MNRDSRLRVLGLMALLWWCGTASAIPISFEDRSDAESITNQYAGVQFVNATALVAGLSLNELSFPPQSGNVAVFDDGGPLSLLFLDPVSSFSAFFTYTTALTITAFDDASNLLASVTSAFDNNTADGGAAGSLPNELLQLNVANNAISRLVISGLITGGSFVVDDVSFAVAAQVPVTGTLQLMLLPLLAGLLWRRRYGRR